jgi:hypothetical protein
VQLAGEIDWGEQLALMCSCAKLVRERSMRRAVRLVLLCLALDQSIRDGRVSATPRKTGLRQPCRQLANDQMDIGVAKYGGR